jgi:hypothetical protein
MTGKAGNEKHGRESIANDNNLFFHKEPFSGCGKSEMWV